MFQNCKSQKCLSIYLKKKGARSSKLNNSLKCNNNKMFADDIVICSESKEEVKVGPERLRWGEEE